MNALDSFIQISNEEFQKVVATVDKDSIQKAANLILEAKKACISPVLASPVMFLLTPHPCFPPPALPPTIFMAPRLFTAPAASWLPAMWSSASPTVVKPRS